MGFQIGKGMANGFPLSAIVGRREVMMEMEEIFFSGTFGGELLSLAAAKSVLTRHLAGGICEKLFEIGGKLSGSTKLAINENNLAEVISLSGHNSWKFLNWKQTEEYTASQLKTYFLQEAFKSGLIILSTFNVTTAFGESKIKETSEILNEVFRKIDNAIKTHTLERELQVRPLEPLFKVR